MNSAKKAKRLDAVSHLRKRNSTSYKPASHNAVQGRASLLKNNKILAVTLQDTRCELSNYKAFFEESLECISKVKIAKSKMVQLSTALKDFVKAFDETLLSMEFDDTKWINFKVSPQSSKVFENEMNPVLEVADEVLHCSGSSEEEMNTNSECSIDHPVEAMQRIIHGKKEDGLKKISFKSPQKETEPDGCNLNNVALALDSEIGKAKGNVGMKTKVPNLLTQTIKTTKIPRCKTLSVNLKNEKESEPRNKASKRKSPEKKSEVSESDFSRRKTFVVKSSSSLENSESKDVETKNLLSENEMMHMPPDALVLKNKRKTFVKKGCLKDSVFAANLNDMQDMNSEININKDTEIQGDEFIIKYDKRKTFVKKSSLKDSVFAANLNYMQDMDSEINVNKDTEIPGDALIIKNDKRKTFVRKSGLKNSVFAANLNDAQDMNSEININKGTVIPGDELIIKNNKRKTFVKKNNKTVSNQNNDYQATFPNNKCTSVDSELGTLETKNFENNEETVFLKPSSHLQSQMPLSETDDVFCKNTGEGEPTEAVTSPNINIASVTPSEEIKGADKILIVNEPSNPKNNKEQNLMKNMASETSSEEMIENNEIPITNESSSSQNKTEQQAMKTVIFRDCLEVPDSDCEEIPLGVRQSSRWKSYKAFLESSDSECEEIPIVESFSDKTHPVKTTPIRGQIKNKKKKFVFDSKKRKSILKKESICKIMRSETDRTNTNRVDSGIHEAVCDDENNHLTGDRNAVHAELDVLVHKKGHSDNTESEADNISNMYSMMRKTKDIHRVSVESTYAKKKTDKSCKIKSSKKHSSKNVELDPVPLKTKKRDIKKKNVYDDLNILKFSEEENFTVDTIVQCNETEKETELGFPCKRTGENTYLVQAEIHPPPPSLNTLDGIKEIDKENEMFNLQNMQVAVVLEDVFKSNNIDISNFCDKKSLCKKTVSLKIPLSANTSNITLEADSSIEKFRCDDIFEAGSSDLLDVGGSDVQDEAVLDLGAPRPRRRKEVNYKEPSLHRKMRRC